MTQFVNEPILELRRAPHREALLGGHARAAPSRRPSACRCGSATASAHGEELVSTDPGDPERVVATAASASADEAAEAVATAARGFARWSATPRRAARGDPRPRRRVDARAPRRARRAGGPRVRQALGRGRRRRLRGHRLPRVLRARRRRPGARARRSSRCPASATSCATRRAASSRSSRRGTSRSRSRAGWSPPGWPPATPSCSSPPSSRPPAADASSARCARPACPPTRSRCCPARARRAPRSWPTPTSTRSPSPGPGPVGLEILETAAEARAPAHLKRVVAEMGGKNCVIVDSDADLDDAVPAIVQSAFLYAGQKCSAASRVLVHEAIADAFLERVAGAVEVLAGRAGRDLRHRRAAGDRARGPGARAALPRAVAQRRAHRRRAARRRARPRLVRAARRWPPTCPPTRRCCARRSSARCWPSSA